MFPARFGTACASLLLMAGLGGVFLLATERDRQISAPQRCFAVAPGISTTRFVLPGRPDQRHLIIIGSLDRDLRTHQVRMSSVASESVQNSSQLVPLELSTPSRPADLSSLTAPPSGEAADSTHPRTGPPSQTRRFVVHTGDGAFDDRRFYRPVTAQLVASNAALAIYQDPQGDPPLPEFLTAILNDFVAIRSGVSRLLRSHAADVDDDGRFTILLTAASRARRGLSAYVRPADFADCRTPLSNQCDMMYLRSDLTPGPFLRAVLAHEYAHAVCCSQPTGIAGDQWLNEGLAHVVERGVSRSWANLDYRISEFLSAPESSPLVVNGGPSEDYWRHPGSRGAAYLFVDSLQQDTLGEFLPRFVADGGCGMSRLERAAERSFPAAFREWLLTLATEAKHPADGSLPYSSGGPRRHRWSLEADVTITVTGTAAAFVEVEPARDVAECVVVLEHGPNSQPQISVMVLPPTVVRDGSRASW